MLINRHGHVSYNTDFFEKHLENIFVHKDTNPHFIIDTDGNFTHLDKFTHPAIKDTVNFYIREIPYLGIKNFDFPDASVIDISKTFCTKKELKATLVGFTNKQKPKVCFELEAIQRFVDKHNITANVYTGLYNFKMQYNLNLITKDFYLQECVKHSEEHTPRSYNPKHMYTDVDTIDKKFICLNGRKDGLRELVAAYMQKHDCYLSLNNNKVEFKVVKGNKDLTDYFYNNNIKDRICFATDINTKNLSKITLDLDLDETLENDKTFFYTKLPDEYYKSFCNVVTESKFFFPYGHFADKLLNAIKMCRPFVVFSSPNTLAYAKSLGFKTFDMFWDESYDAEVNHKARFNKLLDVIEYINFFTLDELKDMYKEMLPIIEHNFYNLEKIHDN